MTPKNHHHPWHSRTDAHMTWQSLREHIQDLHRFKSDETAKRKWTQSPSPHYKEATVNWLQLEKGTNVFSHGRVTDCVLHTLCQAPCDTKQTPWIFCVLFILFQYFFLFFWLLGYFVVVGFHFWFGIFVWFFRDAKRYKMRLGGEHLERSWRRDKTVIIIYLWKK